MVEQTLLRRGTVSETDDQLESISDTDSKTGGGKRASTTRTSSLSGYVASAKCSKTHPKYMYWPCTCTNKTRLFVRMIDLPDLVIHVLLLDATDVVVLSCRSTMWIYHVDLLHCTPFL